MPDKKRRSSLQRTEKVNPTNQLAVPIPPIAALDPGKVARLADSYWELRGCENGSPDEDWFKAENHLKMRTGRPA